MNKIVSIVKELITLHLSDYSNLKWEPCRIKDNQTREVRGEWFLNHLKLLLKLL